MNKKVLFIDLDNTIYPVSSIGAALFDPLFNKIKDDGRYLGDFNEIKEAIMRRPFQKVARDFNFNCDLINKSLILLESLECNMSMKPFNDYTDVKNIRCQKFLITTGFTKMQNSKIDNLNIREDFKEIHIVDPQLSNLTKKDIFLDIINRHNFNITEILVIGDDINSEIKAAKTLGIDVVLIDKIGIEYKNTTINSIQNFSELYNFL